jgi:hypothetical protein
MFTGETATLSYWMDQATAYVNAWGWMVFISVPFVIWVAALLLKRVFEAMGAGSNYD